MNCPKCNSMQVIVIITKRYPKEIMRRRECLDCGFRFNTKEVRAIETERKLKKYETKDCT